MKTVLYIGLILGATLFQGCKKAPKTVKPVYKALTEAVYASGSLHPRNEFQVFSQIEGNIVEKAANEGNLIQRGQTLYRVERDEQAIRTANSAELLAIARRNAGKDSPVLGEIKAQVDAIRARLLNDSLNYLRFKDLLQSSATTKAEFERRELAFTASKNDLSAAIDRYKRTQNQLAADLQNAEAAFQLQNAAQTKYDVKSSMSGRVYQLTKEQGEGVRRGETVALIGDAENVYLQLTVDELDVNKVKEGQEVLVKIDAYKNRVFKAKVEKVYRLFNRKEQTFRVDAALEDSLPGGFIGLTVETNIIIRQSERALTLPKSAISTDDSVKVYRDGQTRKVKITRGVQNFEEVEILNGLSPEEQVVVE